MTAPRFCSMATAMGRAAKRWRKAIAQSSMASGVLSRVPDSGGPPSHGARDQKCFREAQSMAVKAAQSGSAVDNNGAQGVITISFRGGPTWIRESLIVSLGTDRF